MNRDRDDKALHSLLQGQTQTAEGPFAIKVYGHLLSSSSSQITLLSLINNPTAYVSSDSLAHSVTLNLMYSMYCGFQQLLGWLWTPSLLGPCCTYDMSAPGPIAASCELHQPLKLEELGWIYTIVRKHFWNFILSSILGIQYILYTAFPFKSKSWHVSQNRDLSASFSDKQVLQVFIQTLQHLPSLLLY